MLNGIVIFLLFLVLGFMLEESFEDDLPYVDITPDKLNLDYVTELINEIEELEKNPQLYDASRILYLHTELDAILEILGQ